MTPAFLPADVCRALVEAGMVVEDGHRDWWVQFGTRWERQFVPKYSLPERALLDNEYTPAVTPLQALDWLVASGRIGGYSISNNSIEDIGIHCGAWDAQNWVLCFDRPVTTPTDLVRAVLGMEVAQ